MTGAARASSSTSRTAVIVVHGIGKPPPGETVDQLVSSLRVASAPFSPSGVREEHALTEYSRGDGKNRTFPCHVRRATHAIAGEFTFAEVWWGSKARVASGFGVVLNLLLDTLDLIIGLGSALRAGDRSRSHVTHRLVRQFGMIVSWVLTGPVFAINVALLILVAVHFVLGETRYSGGGRLGVELTGVICVLAAIYGLARAAGPSSSLSARAKRLLLPCDAVVDLRWMLGCLLLIGAYVSVTSILFVETTWQSWASRAFELLDCALLTAQIAFVLTVSIHVLTAAFDGKRRQSFLIATTCALQFGLWRLLLLATWTALAPSLRAKPGAPAGDFEFQGLYVDRFYLQTTPILAALSVAAIAAAVVGVRQLLSRYDIRLIIAVAPAVAVQLVMCAACLIGLADTANGFELIEWHSTVALQPIEEFGKDIGLDHAMGLVLVLLALAPAVARTALDLTDDVLAYLAKYGVTSSLRQSGYRRWNRGDERRTRSICSRFRRVAEFVHGNGPWNKVVVIAHSQGTVIAIDELALDRHGEAESRAQRGKLGQATAAAYSGLFEANDSTLITFGSPLGHVYRHYFPHLYPKGTDDHWQPLRKRIDKWVNVFRSDDFVGRDIEPFATERQFPCNRNVGIGGHADYWSDAKALAIVQQALALAGPAREDRSAETAAITATAITNRPRPRKKASGS